MKYAVMTGNTIWTIHNTIKAGTESLKIHEARADAKAIPNYSFTLLELLPKGEKDGWEKGDTPAPQYIGEAVA